MGELARQAAGVVLAGGQASRLGGGDKPLRTVGRRTMLDLVLDRLRPQVGQLAINANGDPSRFSGYSVPVIADNGPRGSVGPLTGILAALEWAGDIGATKVLTVAGDTPFFPRDLAARLDAAVRAIPDGIAIAASGGRGHPVVALWPVFLGAELRAFVATSETLSVAAFQERHPAVSVDFPLALLDGREIDPFFNVNTPEDLAKANALAESVSL